MYYFKGARLQISQNDIKTNLQGFIPLATHHLSFGIYFKVRLSFHKCMMSFIVKHYRQQENNALIWLEAVLQNCFLKELYYLSLS